MMQMFFFIKFKSQLRRVRPELVSHLEDTVVQAVKNAGGNVIGERRLVKASFNEDTPCFWLDMLLFVETVMKIMEEAAANLYGYSLLLGRDLFDPVETQSPESFCRSLAGLEQGGGIFLDRVAKEGLLPYANAEAVKTVSSLCPPNPLPGVCGEMGDFFRLGELKIFVPMAKADFPLREAAETVLRQGLYRTALMLGPLEGKGNALYRYCDELSGGIPPLVIRFGGSGLNALVDAWPAQLRSLANADSPTETAAAEEINRQWTFLFRERLRDESSPFAARTARRFLAHLLQFYDDIARHRGLAPIIVLENIHLANEAAAEIVIGAYTGIKYRQDFIVLGTCGESIGEQDLQQWKPVFPRLIRFNAGALPAPGTADALSSLPPDLLEMVYALSLFCRYYPAAFFPRLLEESGKNPAAILRGLSMLSSLGIIDSAWHLRHGAAGFAEHSGAIPEERKERVRALVCGRLLHWVQLGKLTPCFNLLLATANLGGAQNLDAQIILQSIVSDLINGTFSGVERAQNAGMLNSIAGAEQVAALHCIIKTTQALLGGRENEIRAAFAEAPPDCASSPVLAAYIMANVSAFYLSLRDHDSAQETAKKAIALCKGKNSPCLARSYRLCALSSLARQRIGEALDYLNFALDSAGQCGDYYELALSAYYAAAVQFLFGNLSGAMQLARKSSGCAMEAGCPEWADLAYFFEGRLNFEIGRYDEAQELFEQLRREPQGKTLPEKEGLFAAWSYRAKVYSGNPHTLKPQNAVPDLDIFEMEAALFAENYQRAGELAAALAEALVAPCAEDHFLSVETPGWRSGFAQCEHLCFSQGEIQGRLAAAYHALSICRSAAGRGSEAADNIQRLLRHGQVPEADPCDSLYFYILYLVLEQNKADHIDTNTALSMAINRLQHRASRIEDMETRRQFLSLPYWNKALCSAAREFKLI